MQAAFGQNIISREHNVLALQHPAAIHRLNPRGLLFQDAQGGEGKLF